MSGQSVRSSRRSSRPVLIEQLENRQLMHAVVDLRVAGGGQSANITNIGQVINLEVWVTITGHNGNPNDEGLQIMTGSFLSTNISGGAANGTLSFTRVAPFNALGSSDGAQADLDADGDFDVGSNNATLAAGFFAPRSSSMTTTGGTTDGDSHSWLVGTGTFTVTSLNDGVQTNLAFRPRIPVNGLVYVEDGQTLGPPGGAEIGTGDTIVLKRTPGTASISGRVFDDKNANGIFDGADVGISGFRVFLDEDFDGVLDGNELNKPVSTTGTYTFSNVVAGTYRVREVPRDGWRQSAPAAGYHQVTIGYGQVAKSLSIANTQGVLIKGKVWHDSDQDRTIDAAESPLAGWRVILDVNKNNIWDAGDISTTTNSKGEYRFSLLEFGNFHVMAKQATGWRQTTNGGSFHDITLPAGGTTSNKNFGFKRLKV